MAVAIDGELIYVLHDNAGQSVDGRTLAAEMKRALIAVHEAGRAAICYHDVTPLDHVHEAYGRAFAETILELGGQGQDRYIVYAPVGSVRVMARTAAIIANVDAVLCRTEEEAIEALNELGIAPQRVHTLAQPFGRSLPS